MTTAAIDQWNITCSSPSINITLPHAPKKVSFEAAADVKEYSFPTKSNSLLISLGKKIDKLTIQGTLVRSSYSAENLYDTYIGPLASTVRKSVTLDLSSTGTATRYDGAWIINKFTYEEVGGYTVSYTYTIEFIRGVDGSNTAPGIVI